MKILKSIYYFFRYGFKGYRTWHMLDVLQIYLENVGIKSISVDSLETSFNRFYYTIIFNDSTYLKFWNGGRWWFWMTSGTIEFSNGKILTWDARDNKMPSYEVLFKFKKVIKEYEKGNAPIKKQKNYSDDYSEYLPLKLARKIKL